MDSVDFINLLKDLSSYLLSLRLDPAISPSLGIMLLFCDILLSKDNFPFPPTGKHEELEADRSRLAWIPSELDSSLWSYSLSTRKHDPRFFIIILMGLDQTQESQLTSTDSSHEVEGLLWLDLGDHGYFIPGLVSDMSLFYPLLGGRHYP